MGVRRRLKVKVDIYQRMIERESNLFRHVCRMDNERLIKTVLFGGIMEYTIIKPEGHRREWLEGAYQECCNMCVFMHLLFQTAWRLAHKTNKQTNEQAARRRQRQIQANWNAKCSNT